MNENQAKRGGVIRDYDRSIFPKAGFALGHLLIVLICVWLVFFEGWSHIGSVFGVEWVLVDRPRAFIMVICAGLYWVRHVVTLFYMLNRKVEWSEVGGLLFVMILVDIGLTLLAGGAFRDHSIELNGLDLLALALLLSGSFLNSFSEAQRKWWKKKPANKGHCFTGGLFRYASHINYFGDTVLFTGWCLFSHNFWTLGLPLFMAVSFVFFHIPGLDTYLTNRYGEEFTAYASRTKKFVPFVY